MAKNFGYVQFVRTLNGTPQMFSIPGVMPEDHPAHRLSATVRIPYEAQENGFPVKLSSAHKVEDQVIKQLESPSMIFAGHILGDGHLLILFRCRERPPTEVKVKTGLFKSEVFPVTVRDDPDWNWQMTETWPTPVEIEASRNIKLHATLEQQGDVAGIPRLVDFTFNFPSDSDRAACLEALTAQGYKLNKEGMWDGEDGQRWFSVDFECVVEEGEMADRCAAIRTLAEHHNGDFDGWACHVTRSV